PVAPLPDANVRFDLSPQERGPLLYCDAHVRFGAGRRGGGHRRRGPWRPGRRPARGARDGRVPRGRALGKLCEVSYDPWIDQRPLRIWDGAALAQRVDALGATVLVCEADFVSGPVLDRPLRVIGSTRGDPTNVDIAGATARGSPGLHTPGRNADGVAELPLALLLAVPRRVLPADRDLRAGAVF